MPDGFEKTVLKVVGIGALYVLASPIYLVKAVRDLQKDLALKRLLDEGWVVCPHCGERNPLFAQETCRRCGWTEMGCRIWCSRCRKQVADRIDCQRCFNSIGIP